MQFDSVLEVEGKKYIIEHFSKKLISIDKGEANVLISLPWQYTPAKNGMLLFGDLILIYSIYCNYFFLYKIKSGEKKKIRFENLRCDSTGRYYSNLLIYQDSVILLPFEGNNINIYECNGRLKDSFIWWSDRLLKSDNEKNIRENSAVIVDDNIFFSLRYKKENYLCNYNLNRKENMIVYNSNEVAIRGIYVWNDRLIFRRIYPNKTEVVFWDIKEKKANSVVINDVSPFDADIYISKNQLHTFVFNKIIAVTQESYEVIFELDRYQSYIGNGIIFDLRKNELLKIRERKIFELNGVLDYIRRDSCYIDGYRKLFSSYIIKEEAYSILNLFEYLNIVNPNLEKVLEKDINESNIWKLIT